MEAMYNKDSYLLLNVGGVLKESLEMMGTFATSILHEI